MNSPLATVMDDLTTTREAGIGVDDSSSEQAVALDLPLGVELLLSCLTTVLVVRFATGLATLLLTVFIAWITEGRHPPSQLAAMVTSCNPAPDQNWHVDSGATNHITNDS